jgi:hypothetical protein
MGYYMDQRGSEFRIKRENFAAALAVLVELAGDQHKEQMGGWSCSQGGKCVEKHYAWVNMDKLKNAKSIEEAMSAWRWQVDIEEGSGDIEYIMFNGEKLGDDTIMLEAIAPFVEDDSYIEMSGEEGAIWRWTFDNGKFDEKGGTVLW